MGVELVSLDKLYKKSNFISIHVPLTNETKNLVNKDAFAKMKKGVKIINCARGGIVNEKDLCDAIKGGIVSSAALDVFEKEQEAFTKLYEAFEVIIRKEKDVKKLLLLKSASEECSKIIRYSADIVESGNDLVFSKSGSPNNK